MNERTERVAATSDAFGNTNLHLSRVVAESIEWADENPPTTRDVYKDGVLVATYEIPYGEWLVKHQEVVAENNFKEAAAVRYLNERHELEAFLADNSSNIGSMSPEAATVQMKKHTKKSRKVSSEFFSFKFVLFTVIGLFLLFAFMLWYGG